ncbi:MAG: hypothetical protein HY883_01980 [Deltaproteobacteria bacterium]|nr:hypothetical protein [Deltaproteobacteria bacterium]
MKRVLIAALLFSILAAAPVPLLAVEREKPEPSGDAVVIDLVFMRPLGLISLVAGTGLFIAGVPFTAPTGSLGTAARTLIAGPFRFTFVRPLGEDMDY